LRNLPHGFDIYLVNHEADSEKFCGLLRKTELYEAVRSC